MEGRLSTSPDDEITMVRMMKRKKGMIVAASSNGKVIPDGTNGGIAA
jgi:hypothetical protein